MEKYVAPRPRERKKNMNLIEGVKTIESRNPLVSIIIPEYNEEHSIKNVINRIPKRFVDEIILVDDGSTDNTVKLVKEINRKIKKIELKNSVSDISSMMFKRKDHEESFNYWI